MKILRLAACELMLLFSPFGTSGDINGTLSDMKPDEQEGNTECK